MEKMYEELKDNVKNVIKPLVKKDNLSPAELEALANGLTVVHKVNQICKEEDEREMGEVSKRGMSRDYRSGDEPYRRWEIMSYGDGRDSSYGYPHMGSPYWGDSSYARSQDYSRHSIKDRAIDKLERLMSEAGSDYERQKIKEYIHKVESAE